jgi:hypothetical protein
MQDAPLLLDFESPDAALKPFLQAARESSSANVSTLRALISKVLSDSEIFAGYDELKTILLGPLQQAGAEGTKLLQTLDLFSYGTYNDYVTQNSYYMSLSDAQIFKLRQLTVLSLVQTACCHDKSDRLLYTTVQQALQLQNTNDANNSSPTAHGVEPILISCLYAGVIAGRLCQKTKSVVLYTTPLRSRDVPVAAIPDLLGMVRELQRGVTQAHHDLTRASQTVQHTLQQDALFWNRHAEQRMQQHHGGTDSWSTALVGHPGLLTAEAVTTAAAAMDVTGRRQKRSRGGLSSSGGASAFQL